MVHESYSPPESTHDVCIVWKCILPPIFALHQILPVDGLHSDATIAPIRDWLRSQLTDTRCVLQPATGIVGGSGTGD